MVLTESWFKHSRTRIQDLQSSGQTGSEVDFGRAVPSSTEEHTSFKPGLRFRKLAGWAVSLPSVHDIRGLVDPLPLPRPFVGQADPVEGANGVGGHKVLV